MKLFELVVLQLLVTSMISRQTKIIRCFYFLFNDHSNNKMYFLLGFKSVNSLTCFAPRLLHSFPTAERFSFFLPVIQSEAFCFENALAIAAPMPLEAPIKKTC